jgi:CubicO group peptidase (beta-lactamase class C family)
MAVIHLLDAGKVALDLDVNRYLRRIQVPSQGYAPLTLRHLLSHTGGLDELPGRQFDGASRPDMARFMRDRIVRYREPGRLTAYSTYGIMLAGLVVEDVTGCRFDNYVRDRIFRPVGMAGARIMAVRGDERGVATPYAVEDGRATAMPHEWYVSTPASSAVATAADMGRLLIAHLGGGPGTGPLLSKRAYDLMHRQQASVHPALPGWSLGMQMDRVNGRALAEHGGDIGGFAALFSLIPEEKAGFFIVSHGEGSNLRFRVKQALMEAFFPAQSPPQVPVPRREDAALLQQYAGRYIASSACRSCPSRGEGVFVLEAEPDGTLALWGQRWIPLGRDLFVREDGLRMLGFARDGAGKLISVSAGSFRVADRLDP